MKGSWQPMGSGRGHHFVPDPVGFDRFKHSEPVRRMLFFLATKAAFAAKSEAAAHRDTGAYQRSITADAGLDDHGEPVGRVKAMDFKAHWMEFGTIHQPAYAPIARGVESVTGQTPSDSDHS